MGLVFATFFTLLSSLLTPIASRNALAQVIYTPTPMQIQTADQVINAVNSLRVANGLPSLSVHPILMQVAQWEVDALVNGAGGHTRPDNMTLGQQLLSLGYPLSGDLSQDGYRSENIVFGPGFTVEDAIRLWGSDDPHLNTMLSPNRSDIGVAVASNLDEWGFTVYYYVLETALQTQSGKMQYAASAILTGIPQTQAVYAGEATQWAEDTGLSQYSVPVFVSTPLPDGKVYHEVKYGQTLWSIAITYHTTIKQIQQLNSLFTTNIQVGDILLVLENATLSAPTTYMTASPVGQTTMTFPIAPSLTPTNSPTETHLSNQTKRRNALSLWGIGFAALVLGGTFTMMMRKKS